MKLSVIRTETSDGLRLDGLWYEPEGAPHRLPLMLLHGAATALAHTLLPEVLGRELTSAGRPFLETSTRGSGWIVERVRCEADGFRSVVTGHAFERFDDCIHDIDAWITWLCDRGADGVTVLARSLGCQKLAYYLSEVDDPRVRAVIFGMPGDPVNDFRAFVGAERHAASTKLAQTMVEGGRARELADFGLGAYFSRHVGAASAAPDAGWEALMSAEAFLSLFGEGAPRDVFSYARPDGGGLWRLGRIRVPVLALSGDVDERIVGDSRDALRKIAAAATTAPRCDTRLLERVPHTWRGHEQAMARLIRDWLDEVVPA